ncbi:glycosyltransferase [Bordetella trematum]|uniref:glycosyltransferase n=1 Tax=Bordetella trematum TaxID=123899 RepID=UPI003AF3A656
MVNWITVKEGNIVLFLGGTIYDYSPEFELFLQALNLLCEQHGKYNISLIVVSGRTKLDVSGLARKTLDQRIQFLDLAAPDDKEYMKYLVLSDVICSPGLPDRFNLYRLPSRLVKAMLIGKPVLTTKIGFGESLKHGKEAILISGDNPDEWAEAMSMIFDREALRCIGEGGKVFAVKNFDAKKVANSLISNFKKVLQ